MLKNKIFFRHIRAVSYIEYFLVSAISSVLGIRLFLELTGYPQIGGDTLHIAHMLWGGLLMLIAIIMLLSFIGHTIENLSAVIGGIGFGTFIDEIGKFLTQDNDYFFQPSVALIYLIFILIFLIVRAVHRRSEYSHKEYLLNAIRELEEVVFKDQNNEDKERVLNYLDKSGNQSEIAEKLRKVLHASTEIQSPRYNIYQRLKSKIRSIYMQIANLPVFKYGIITFFIFQFFTQLIFVITLIFFRGVGGEKYLSFKVFHNISEKLNQLSFVEMAELMSVLLFGVLIFLGIWKLPKSKLAAYRMFERSILVSIFVTQVFVFYNEQFGALIGLSWNLILLAGLKFMIRREVILNLKK